MVFVQRSLPYGLQVRINNEETERTIERIMKKEYPDYSSLLPSKTHESFGPDYILYWWRHLALLSLPGFVAVWFVYSLTRWVIVPFIVTGFKDTSARGGETE
jgi:hypothetical protein